MFSLKLSIAAISFLTLTLTKAYILIPTNLFLYLIFEICNAVDMHLVFDYDIDLEFNLDIYHE